MKGKRPISLADLRWMLGMSRSELGRCLGLTPEQVEEYEPEWKAMPPKLRLVALMLMKLHESAAEQNQASPCWALNECPDGCQCRRQEDAESWIRFAPETPGTTRPDAWERCAQCSVGRAWFARPTDLQVPLSGAPERN